MLSNGLASVVLIAELALFTVGICPAPRSDLASPIGVADLSLFAVLVG